MEPLISVNVTVDQITQNGMLLKRFNDDGKLTAVTIVSNRKDIPETTGSARYEPVPLDTFIGENVTDWDGHSALTLYFRGVDGKYDHWEKAAGAKTGAAA